MSNVLSMSQARVRAAAKKAKAKEAKEQERDQKRVSGNKLQAALEKFGSFSGLQMKKKEEEGKKDGDV